jgi:SAM-dependent methyltransferase
MLYGAGGRGRARGHSGGGRVPVTSPRTPGRLGRPVEPGERRLDQLAPLAPNAWLRYDIVRRMLPAGARDVLEIGCGRGSFGARLALRYEYLGIEPDGDSFAVASARLDAVGRGQVRPSEWSELEGQHFDLVCAFEVLEHIKDDERAVAEWVSLVRPGGSLLLSVPASPARFGPWDELVGHYRRYDAGGITRLLTVHGLTDVRTCLYGFPLAYGLETARNVIARRRLTTARNTSLTERTAGSGRQFQPSSGVTGTASRWLTSPFRALQRAFPAAGTGIVVIGTVAGG